MNVNEALEELQQREKPYEKVGMPQSSFSNTIKNIKHRLCKPATVENFLGKFGYAYDEINGWHMSN